MRIATQSLRLFICVLLAVVGLAARAQDVIILQSGGEIEADVQEVRPNAILYKPWEQPEADVLRLAPAEVVLIRYRDGRVEIIEAGFYVPEPAPDSLPPQTQPEDASDDEVPAADPPWRETRHALKLEAFAYLTGHMGINYERVIGPGLNAELRIGIVGLGAPVRAGFDNTVIFPGGTISSRKSDERGYFAKIGVKIKATNRVPSLQGLYVRPEFLVSQIWATGVEQQINNQPSDYDYTYRYTGNTLGGFLGIGWQFMPFDRLTIDMNGGLGYVVSNDFITREGLVSPNAPLPQISGNADAPTAVFFRYSHLQLLDSGGPAVTMGLSVGYAF
ncbi:MAG: hypothetical protein OHK0039_11560 [Bacteroidia bacterium]